jgi:putative sterol carrier protein
MSLSDQIRPHLAQLAGLGYKVRFALDDGTAVLIDATQTPVVMSEAPDEADCTIRMSRARMEQLMDGRLSPALAYTLGQIKIDGSLGVAMKLASMLDN